MYIYIYIYIYYIQINIHTYVCAAYGVHAVDVNRTGPKLSHAKQHDHNIFIYIYIYNIHIYIYRQVYLCGLPCPRRRCESYRTEALPCGKAPQESTTFQRRCDPRFRPSRAPRWSSLSRIERLVDRGGSPYGRLWD